MAEYVPGHDMAASLTAVICFLLLTVKLFRSRYPSDILFGTAVILLIASCGYLLYEHGKKRIIRLEQKEMTFRVTLSEYPDKSRSGYSFRASVISAGNEEGRKKSNGSMLLYYMSDSLEHQMTPGDIMVVRTTPLPVRNNGNPCEFNYKRYMEGRGTGYYGFISSDDLISVSPPGHRSLKDISLIAARRITGLFAAAGLAGDDLGLVTALTIGEKDLLDRDLLTSFSKTGAMHIMAVSGLHVGMISLCLSSLLFFLKKKGELLKVIIILAGLWIFAFITGLSPSVLRATIMFSFLQAGRLLKRPGNEMNTLLASAFILLLARPAVLFEAGFQLSYIAVAFILAFYGPLYRIIRIKNRILDWLWQMVAVSLVAQAGTFPLTVHLFNIFPLSFLATNIFVIPVSFAVIIIAFLLAGFSFLSPLASLLASLLKFCSQAILAFTHSVVSIPHSVIENIGFTTTETMLLTLAVWLLLTALLRTNSITLRPFLVTTCLFVLLGITKNYRESHIDQLVTYHIRGKVIDAKQTGRVIYVNTANDQIPGEVRKHASTRGLKIEPCPVK